MAARDLKSTQSSQSFVIVQKITTGAVSTTIDDAMIFEMNKSTSVGTRTSLITGVPGAQFTVNHRMNSPELTTWLAANISADTEAGETGYYENGVKYTVSSGATPTLFFAVLGGENSGKIQTWYGCCQVSMGDGTLEYKKDFESPLTITTMEWNGSSALTVADAFWDLCTKTDGSTKFLDTADLGIPNTLAIGKASAEAWLKKA